MPPRGEWRDKPAATEREQKSRFAAHHRLSDIDRSKKSRATCTRLFRSGLRPNPLRDDVDLGTSRRELTLTGGRSKAACV